MASKQEFEMLFALNARMNGGFSGTFSKAQAEFTRLGKEIQSLHKVQGDIASYQKQQSAIEATRSKLENLQKQHDLLQKEIGETDGSTTALERENAKLEQRIKDTETALERQNQKLQTTGARLEDAKINTDDLAGESARLSSRLDELSQRQQGVADSAQEMGQAHEDAAGDAASFGEQSVQAVNAVQEALAAAGIAVALKEIADAFMECVGIAADFEEAMSTVEALSQANAREMAALTAEAKELGATTKFTAKESADAMGYMAMAGWDATDMLQGMDGVLQLAAASGEDLAMVSDIVTDSLSAFGLTARDTAHFSDVLAAAATNSNTNVAIMGETFKMSASVAGALGYSIEDVAVAMGLMANSGVKGSIAGTALKNTFNGLLEGVTLTGAAFGEYEYSAVKADGTMKDFGSTINELRGYFEQMTEAERVNNAIAIAGQRGYNGLLAILNATDADYASLTNSINNCTGAAQKMANVKLDNMNGQLTLMKSAWDALKTTIGEQFIPEMRALYEVGTDVFGGIDKFIQENPGVVKGIAAGAAVIGTVTAGLMAYSAGAKIAAAASALLSASIPGVNIILGVTAAVAGAVGVVTALSTAADAGIPSVKELTEAARDMQEAMDEAGAAFEQTATQTVATAEVAGIYIDKLEKIEAAEGENARSSQEYQNVLGLLLRTMPELSDCISETTDEYGRSTYTLSTSTQSLRENTEELKKNAQARAYQEYLNALYDQYGSVLQEAAESSIKLTQAQIKLDTAEEKRAAAVERMNEINEIGIGDNQELLQEYWQLENALTGYNDEILKAQKEIDNLNEAINADEKAVAAAEAEIKSAEDAVAQLTGATEKQTAAEAEAAAQAQELQGIIGDTAEQIAELAEAYNDAYDAAFSSISGQYDLWDQADKVVATSTGNINKALESQITYWQDYNSNLQYLNERADDIEGLREVIDSFADGSPESVNAIAGISAALRKGNDEDIQAIVENYQQLQEEQRATVDSLALFVTDFERQMDQLVLDMEKDVKDMDLSYAAALSAQATIQGYVDAAEGMLPRVREAWSKVGQSALEGLNGYLYIPTNAAGADLPASVRARMMTERGYASGTQNAEPGWAMVGEDGPELMFFNGGEKVLNATQTSALQAKAAPAVSAKLAPTGTSMPPVSLTFQIGGNATPEVVQDLRGFADEIVDRFMDALEEAGVDAQRRAY